MPLAEKANDVAGTVNDQCEQVYNVSTQNAEVEGGRIGYGSKAAMKSDWRSGFPKKL
jgi:hypothetical protein